MPKALTAVNDVHSTSDVTRLRNALLILVTLMVFLTGMLIFRSEISVSRDGGLVPSVTLMILIGGGTLVLKGNSTSAPALAASATGIALLASIAGAAISMLVLRWGFPQADDMLLTSDAAIGVDVVGLIERTASVPVAAFGLRYIYSTSIPLLLLSLMILGLSNNQSNVWRTCFLFVGTLLTTCLISGLFPAKGAFINVDAEIINALPEGVGTYAFETFDLFYAGNPPSISFASLNGVACFPSFHTAAALIFVRAWWHFRRVRPALVAWCGLVLYSTIPIGGHYLVDILAGALLFYLWLYLADRISDRQSKCLNGRVAQSRFAS